MSYSTSLSAALANLPMGYAQPKTLVESGLEALARPLGPPSAPPSAPVNAPAPQMVSPPITPAEVADTAAPVSPVQALAGPPAAASMAVPAAVAAPPVIKANMGPIDALRKASAEKDLAIREAGAEFEQKALRADRVYGMTEAEETQRFAQEQAQLKMLRDQQLETGRKYLELLNAPPPEDHPLTRLGKAISIGLGAYAAAMTGSPNFALQIINEESRRIADAAVKKKEALMAFSNLTSQQIDELMKTQRGRVELHQMMKNGAMEMFKAKADVAAATDNGTKAAEAMLVSQNLDKQLNASRANMVYETRARSRENALDRNAQAVSTTRALQGQLALEEQKKAMKVGGVPNTVKDPNQYATLSDEQRKSIDELTGMTSPVLYTMDTMLDLMENRSAFDVLPLAERRLIIDTLSNELVNLRRKSTESGASLTDSEKQLITLLRAGNWDTFGRAKSQLMALRDYTSKIYSNTLKQKYRVDAGFDPRRNAKSRIQPEQ